MSGRYPGERPGQYTIGEKVISEPLREDPAARAAYSGKPGFASGAEEPHPIHTSRDSLLVKPEIAEALEAMHGLTYPDTAKETFAIDTALALQGLSWLRGNVTDLTLRLRVIDTKGILARRGDGSQEQTNPQAQLLEAGQSAEQIHQARRAAQEKLQAEGERQVAALADQVATSLYPGIDTGITSDLMAKLAVSGNPNQPTIRERKGFQGVAHHRLELYMDDPSRLVHDLATLSGMAFLAGRPETREAFPAAGPFIAVMGDTIFNLARQSSYNDGKLDDERIDHWFSVMEAACAAQMTPDDRMQSHLETEWTVAQHANAIEAAERFGWQAAMTYEMLSISNIIPNTLHAIAAKDPVEFVDRLYTLIERSLKPTHDLAANMGVRYAEQALRSPLGRCIVGMLATADRGAFEPRIQRQGVDLWTTLTAAGIPDDEVAGPTDIDKLTAQEDALLAKSVLSIERGSRENPWHESAYDGGYAEFLQQVESEDKAPTTLYGRFLKLRGWKHSDISIDE